MESSIQPVAVLAVSSLEAAVEAHAWAPPADDHAVQGLLMLGDDGLFELEESCLRGKVTPRSHGVTSTRKMR